MDKGGGKHRTYSLLKNDHEIEPCLKSNIPRHYIFKIAALRVGSHDLEIEHWRYSNQKIPTKYRYCNFVKKKLRMSAIFSLNVYYT